MTLTTNPIDHTDTRPRSATPRQFTRAVARPLSRFLASWTALMVLCILWQIAATVAPSPFFPPPLAILTNAFDLLFSGPPAHLFMSETMLVDGIGTLSRTMAGFVIGSSLGVLVGTANGLSRIVRESTEPVVEFLRSVPATASLPLFIILLGADDWMRVAFIAWGSSWFVLINTTNGVASIHPTLLDTGRAFRTGYAKRLFRLILPAAAPKIFAGLRIALVASLMLAIASEFMLAPSGIGQKIVLAQQRFYLLDMWSWLLFLAVVGLALNTLFELVEARVIRWHRLSTTQQ